MNEFTLLERSSIVITQISEAVINQLYDYAELAHESMSTVRMILRKWSVLS